MKVSILFPKIFDHPFTYKSEISDSLNTGDFVKAPFGNSEITGIVWPHEQKTKRKFKIKKITKKINVKKLNLSMIEFISWFSKYNLVPLGMSLKMCLLNKDVVEKSFNKEFDQFKNCPYILAIFWEKLDGGNFLVKSLLDPKNLVKKCFL